MGFKLIPIDEWIIHDIRLELNGEHKKFKVKFQFPPIIKSDNKGVSYEEKSFFNIEPYAYFTGSKAREITLKWVYIVNGAESNGVTWTALNVSDVVKDIRSYYYQTLAQFDKDVDLTIKFQGYNVVGESGATPISFRSESISISHSDTLVRDQNDYVYPLKTDISMKLKLWSKGEDKDGKPMIELPNLTNVKQLTAVWR